MLSTLGLGREDVLILGLSQEGERATAPNICESQNEFIQRFDQSRARTGGPDRFPVLACLHPDVGHSQVPEIVSLHPIDEEENLLYQVGPRRPVEDDTLIGHVLVPGKSGDLIPTEGFVREPRCAEARVGPRKIDVEKFVSLTDPASFGVLYVQ